MIVWNKIEDLPEDLTSAGHTVRGQALARGRRYDLLGLVNAETETPRRGLESIRFPIEAVYY